MIAKKKKKIRHTSLEKKKKDPLPLTASDI